MDYVKQRKEVGKAAMDKYLGSRVSIEQIPGSRVSIERFLGRFLNKFKKDRVRRSHNKIRFGFICLTSISHESVEGNSRDIIKRFMRDKTAIV